MKCPNCSTENRSSAKFCDECGFPLLEATAELPQADEQELNSSSAALLEELEEEPHPAIPENIESSEDADLPTERLDLSITNEDKVQASKTGELSANENSEDHKVDSLEETNEANTDTKYLGDTPEKDIPEDADTQVTLADLSGFLDEEDRLVDSDYVQPKSQWGDGNTMKMEPIKSNEDEQKSKDYLSSATVDAKPSSKKKLALSIVGVLIAIALIAGVTYMLQMWGGAAVPDVIGMSEADATEVLQQSGFAVKPMQVKSDDTEGQVLVMDPSAGSRAPEGSEIIIHIATARLIPDVIGKTQKEADKLLKDSGFTNVTYKEKRSSKKLGTVISIKPAVGKQAKSSDQVTVTTAKPYTVPDISGMYLNDAQAAIEKEGLVPEVSYIYTENADDGLIIGTDPAAGTEVQEGSTVLIQIARSREAECIALTQSYLAPGSTVSIGMYNYEIESLDSVTYVAENTVAYTMTARPFISGFGETAYFSTQTLQGQIEWTASNEIASMTS